MHNVKIAGGGGGASAWQEEAREEEMESISSRGRRRQRVAAAWGAEYHWRKSGLQTGMGAWEVSWELLSNVLFYILTVLCFSLSDDDVVIHETGPRTHMSFVGFCLDFTCHFLSILIPS